jgi:hypothetical protein
VEIRIEVEDAYLARLAWLAAVLATPEWKGGDGKRHKTEAPLWATLTDEAARRVFMGMDEDPVAQWDRLLALASEMAGVAGAPSRPLGRASPGAWTFTHVTQNDFGATTVELVMPSSLKALALWVVRVNGPRPEAVLRRAYAAANLIEDHGIPKRLLVAPPATEPQEAEPEIIKRYTAEEE